MAETPTCDQDQRSSHQDAVGDCAPETLLPDSLTAHGARVGEEAESKPSRRLGRSDSAAFATGVADNHQVKVEHQFTETGYAEPYRNWLLAPYIGILEDIGRDQHAPYPADDGTHAAVHELRSQGESAAAEEQPPTSSYAFNNDTLDAQHGQLQAGLPDAASAEQPQAQMAEEQHLVPDEFYSDSAVGSDTQSETTSLAQSIFDYRQEHGRTYHAYKDGKYIFPNDEREADRLDLQHHLLCMTYADKLHFAPLDSPKRALDIGTGTGIWALDFADQYPNCEVTGIDLSPGQPSMVPPNLRFIVDDAEDQWLYEQKFDYVHLRLMAGCFADWPKLFRQAYENLEPGGWLELQDYGLPVKCADGTADNTDLMRWGELLCEAARSMGRPMGSECADNHLALMAEAGFVDIQQKMFMWPSNTWPKDPFMKELGRWNQVNILEGLEGFCLALLTRGMGWKKLEVDVLVAKVSQDLRDRKIHAYFPMPVCWARKPFPGAIA